MGEDGRERDYGEEEATIEIYTSAETATERIVYSGGGLSFNAPLLCTDISGNRLRADWDDYKVEVWI